MRESDKQAGDVDSFASSSPGEVYGLAWGDPESAVWLKPVLHEWLLPALTRHEHLCEIGSGGGRWSRYLVRASKPALLIDGTPASEALIRALPWTDIELESLRSNVEFLALPDGAVPIRYRGTVDYVWTFDTFVHFDLPLVVAYLRAISRMLAPGGVLHLHYADVVSSDWFRSPDAWDDVLRPCESFRYVGRAEMAAMLARFGLRPTGREMTFGANGSRLIECVLSAP